MKHIVPFSYFLLASAWVAVRPARAQYILAGQTAGATFVNLMPAKRLSATLAGDHVKTDSLALDADGRFDIQLKVALSTNIYPYVQALMRELHNDAALAEYPNPDYVKHYAS